MRRRIEKLREEMLGEKRFLSVEQAKIIHRVHRERAEEPLCVRRAYALAAALDEIGICIEEGEQIVGNRTTGVRSGVVFPECGLAWMRDELDTLPVRSQDPFEVRAEDAAYIKEVLLPAWEDSCLENRIYREIGQEDDRITSVVKTNQKGRGQGHIIPDIEGWLEKGPAGLIAEAGEYLKREEECTQEQKDFYRSVTVSLEGVLRFYERYAKLAEQREGEDYRLITQTCRNLQKQPPQSYREALQSVWFLMVCLQMESNAASISLGRLDQYLFPWYDRDLTDGVLSREDALELTESFFLKLNQIVCMRSGVEARYFAGFPIGFNLVVGGRDEMYRNLENPLSFLFLEAQKELHLPQPNLSARLFAQSSEEFLAACTDCIAKGGGLPQMFNDEAIIPSLERAGLSGRDAANYGIVGCVELAGCGNMLGWSNASMFNVVKVLELTLNHGVDLLTGEQTGIDTGGLDTYESFEELEAALEKQIRYFVEKMVLCHNTVDRMHGTFMPTGLLSSVVLGCMEKGLDVTRGGAHYNSSGMQFVQVANLIDSLQALKETVYAGKLSGSDLLEQLKKNWPDEELRRFMKQKPLKYGNDIPAVDELANKWISLFCNELKKYRNVRGGNFHVGLYTVSSHVPMGDNVGATCDGRKSREPLADGGISACSGCDRQGPTAVLKSAAAIRNQDISNGTLLNMKFSPSIFREEKDRRHFYSLLRAFVSLKIQHVQFNVVDREELLAAQENPENYRSLLIRVAGYTAYFVALDTKLQNEIIRRTECIF